MTHPKGPRLWRGLVWACLSSSTCLALGTVSLCAARHAKPRVARDDSLNAQVAQQVVEPGDTLWDITDKATGKPWLWPRVWAMNPQITNPHWLFPGDVVHFSPSDEALPNRAELIASDFDIPEVSEAAADKAASGPKVEVITTAAPPSRRKRDLMQQAFNGHFVTTQELREAGKITQAESDKIMQRPGDALYVTFAANKLPQVGDAFLIYRTLREINHPVTRNHFGYLTEICGQATVEQVTGTVGRVRLASAVREIERGQYVTPVSGALMVSVRGKDSSQAVSGVVVAVENDRAMVGEQRLVFLDKGSAQGLERGDALQIFRRGDPVTRETEGLPTHDFASLVVVDVKNDTATALVVDAVEEISAGDAFRSGKIPP